MEPTPRVGVEEFNIEVVKEEHSYPGLARKQNQETAYILDFRTLGRPYV